MSATSAAQRVADGVAFLDEHRPGWWQPDRFSLDSFRLDDSCCCVVGQIYDRENPVVLGAPFFAAVDAEWLDLTYDLAVSLGLYVGDIEDEDAEYAALDAEWRRVIEARRVEGVTA